MPQAHLYAQWRETIAPLRLNLQEAQVSNGVVRVGDFVRELPALHHIQPCACTLCRDRPDDERIVRVQAIGSRDGLVYVVLPGAYECPALEVERVDDYDG
jgi:hypothetical protein